MKKKRFAFLEYAHKSGAFLFVFKMGKKTGINISSRKEILNNFTKGFKNLVFIYFLFCILNSRNFIEFNNLKAILIVII